MITFELDMLEKKIVVHGDDSQCVNEYPVASDVSMWCINYVKNCMYRCVNQLITARKQAYAHVIYVDGIGDCDRLTQKNEFLQKRSDWLDAYLKFLRFDLMDIVPSGNSRYHANFYKKRQELIDTLEYYRDVKYLYRITNTSVQTKLNLA